jgi:hypothetical protein
MQNVDYKELNLCLLSGHTKQHILKAVINLTE